MRLGPIAAIGLALAAGAWLPLAPVAPLAQEEASELPPLPRPRPQRDGTGTSAMPGDRPSTPATAAINALTSAPQPVTLSAKITQDGALVPEGLVWRIFETAPDANGELALVAKSEEGTANLELAPGDYVVHIAYGRAQISDTVTVVAGANEKTFVLDAGALRLNAAVAGDIPITPGLLTFDILLEEAGGSVPIVEGLTPNDIVTLNSGTYHVVSHFGTINAEVRADLRVEAGQLTDATLYHHASQVAFKLVSEPGGEAIADVEWTVQSSDGTELFTDLGAFPSTVLAEGDYIVLAKIGDQVFDRNFQVQAGAGQEVEVLTAVTTPAL
ncbi:MAG: hypothetical protein JWR39_253 [Devosia sp.]|nr:hypothetical protein [Devosia sp.]